MEQETKSTTRVNPNTGKYETRTTVTKAGARAAAARSAVAGRGGAGGLAAVVKASKEKGRGALQEDDSPKQRQGESPGDYGKRLRAYRMKKAAGKGTRAAMQGDKKPE